MKVVDKEHVEHEEFDSSGWFFPTNDVFIRLLHLVYCASLGKKVFDPVNIV